MEKVKYITNRELLLEIHRSKNSYCYYEKPEYAFYDDIVPKLEMLTPEYINAVYEKRLAYATKKNLPLPVKENLVFRFMTSEHIPDEHDLKKRKRNTEDLSMKTKFPPFKHYIVRDGKPLEVGKSHYKNGEFSDNHGRITNRLGEMLKLLVERYSRRANWRGYCTHSRTEMLSQRGWIGIDDMNEKDIVLSLDIADNKLKWSPIKSIYRSDFQGNMFHIKGLGIDATVTPGHRFILEKRGLVPVEYIEPKDKIILIGEHVEQIEKKYSDEFVEIVGWVVTEGNLYKSPDRNYTRITIYQNEGEHANRIRDCLNRLESKFSEYARVRLDKGSSNASIAFNLTKNICNEIIKVITDEKALSMSFILSLTQEQKNILIKTMVNADGHFIRKRNKQFTTRFVFAQKNKSIMDSFQILCTLAGIRTSLKMANEFCSYNKNTISIYKATSLSNKNDTIFAYNLDFQGAAGLGTIERPNEANLPYDGRVWCPETNYGTVVVRDNGKIFAFGQTYNDEMRSHALLQLVEVGLRFDESKSENPFAFYTTIIGHCFTRTLNNEKKMQNIRDDLLIMHDKSPSYTRQIDHEIEQKNEEAKEEGTIEKIVAPKKRGRKPKVKETI